MMPRQGPKKLYKARVGKEMRHTTAASPSQAKRFLRHRYPGKKIGSIRKA